MRVEKSERAKNLLEKTVYLSGLFWLQVISLDSLNFKKKIFWLIKLHSWNKGLKKYI